MDYEIMRRSALLALAIKRKCILPYEEVDAMWLRNMFRAIDNAWATLAFYGQKSELTPAQKGAATKRTNAAKKGKK